MEQTLTDTLGNTIVFKYDESTDSVSVKNSAVGVEFMEVVKNIDSLVVEFDVIMIPDYLDWDNWSDDLTRSELKSFWDEHKVSK
jgi:hypothetical protein